MSKRDEASDWEASFQARHRKEARHQKRIASLTDRSLFKKTDRAKTKAKKLPENLPRGRVLALKGSQIVIDCEGKLLRCSLRGQLRLLRSRQKNLVVVGDFVRFEPVGETQGRIHAIEERFSLLSRESKRAREEQLLAANIDLVLITLAFLQPALQPELIDRYLIAAKQGKMHASLLINKIDLIHQAPSADLQREKKLYEEIVRVYGQLGIHLLPISATTGEGIPALEEHMKGKASVFAGPSGVGKSSLINKIAGASLPIGKMLRHLGSHRTTTAQLIPLQEGGFCIDTPGIRILSLFQPTVETIKAHFFEIAEVGNSCHFPNCRHLTEPDCAVTAARNKGKISDLRFQSYSSLMHALEHETPPF